VAKGQSPKRVRREPEVARSLLLETAKRVMLDEGYAAVGPRRVAQAAEVSPTLVHYYFPTTDDLFIALYRHSADDDHRKLEQALASPNPLQTFWAHQSDGARAALAVEFLAAANHRKALRAEMVVHAEGARIRQAAVLSSIVTRAHALPDNCPPICVATLITAIARTLITESDIGISAGHQETRRFVESMLEALSSQEAEADDAAPSGPA
jgi:AcrR family transcriptional regulator